jgi:hypothetical protein
VAAPKVPTIDAVARNKASLKALPVVRVKSWPAVQDFDLE